MFISDIFSFILKKFVAHTWMVQINDIRQMPIIIPTSNQSSELEILANRAIDVKELTFQKAQPSRELVDFCQELADKQKSAPKYLRPSKQLKLITTADDCLNLIELAVHWALERLYGVEGYGPFSEF